MKTSLELHRVYRSQSSTVFLRRPPKPRAPSGNSYKGKNMQRQACISHTMPALVLRRRRRAPRPRPFPSARGPLQASPSAQPRHVAERGGHAQERLLLLVHGAGDTKGQECKRPWPQPDTKQYKTPSAAGSNCHLRHPCPGSRTPRETQPRPPWIPRAEVHETRLPAASRGSRLRLRGGDAERVRKSVEPRGRTVSCRASPVRLPN